MKKILMTLVLLVGIAAGLFAQKLTYQAVIRDNNQQLVVNTEVKATVTIAFTSGDPYQAEVNGTTNLHGLLSIEFGDATLNGRDWTNATIAVKVVNAATSSIVYVYEAPRPVSAVPYALSVNGMAIQQYLTEHHYVTEMQVGVQIHDSISNIAAKSHTHENMSILNATTAPYTDADSVKLVGIEAGAQKNVKSDWKQTDNAKDDYIKNKPSITDTVNNILTMGKYVTETTLDGRRYLTSDSAVIIKMRSDIDTNKTKISTNATNIETNKENISTNTTNIDNLILHTTKNAIRDSVAGQIHDSISNIAVTFHTHDNKDLLDTYTQTNADLADAVDKMHSHENMSILDETTASFTEEDSDKLDDIEDGAEVNVQSDWDEDDPTDDAYILNKPTNVSAFTNDAGYLTQADLMGLRDTMNAMQNKIDSLSRKLDSLINFIFDIPITFICGISTVKDIDNNEYGTVKIGNQCWMKENLRTTRYADGTNITLAHSTPEATLPPPSTTTAYRYYPEDYEGFVSTYGYLYNWKAVMRNSSSSDDNPSGVQGICPNGWHVPSSAERIQMTNYVSTQDQYVCGEFSEQHIAKALANTTNWQGSDYYCAVGNIPTNNNITGFSAVPAGYYGRESDESDQYGCIERNKSARFWTTTESEGKSVGWILQYFDSQVPTIIGGKEVGSSVRCLKDY